jgi:hypothetical protein
MAAAKGVPFLRAATRVIQRLPPVGDKVSSWRARLSAVAQASSASLIEFEYFPSGARSALCTLSPVKDSRERCC